MGRIHDEHPFAAPPDLRDPARQLRGRLASGVTVVTAGGPGDWAGLTVSSLLIAEGEPSRAVLLIGDTTDLWDALERSGACIVHILTAGQRELSDRFAGIRPSPGGPFAGLDVEDTPWGPAIEQMANRAYCRLERSVETGFHRLVTATIDRIDLTDLTDPLVYFRGRYRTLEPTGQSADS